MTAAELLQRLIRFDTTNPPGGERECIAFVQDLLATTGLESTIVAADPERPNLVARLPGAGVAPPLLLQGHVDVVPTTGQQWSRDPFGGELVDGWIWGRGALDMKGGVAMMINAFMRAHEDGLEPAGDVLLVLLSDEECGGGYGARHLVRDRPDLFKDVRYAIGEFGAFTMEIAGRRFYPVQVAEKQRCSLRVTFRGPGGHGALPVRGGAIAKLGRFLAAVDRTRLPMHVTPVPRLMVETIASVLPRPAGFLLTRSLDPRTSPAVIRLLGNRGRLFDPILHNTVSATTLASNGSHTGIPSEVTVDLDGRILPGFTPADLVRELHAITAQDAEVEILSFEPGPPAPDLGLLGLLRDVLREADRNGTTVPMLLPAITDARHFGTVGIQGYGFTPLQLPSGFSLAEAVHGVDERVPAVAVNWGADRILRVLERYGR